MHCQRCGKNGFVTIGARRYCSHCGHAVAGAPAAKMSDVQIGNVRSGARRPEATQLHRRGSGNVLDLRSPSQAAKAAARSNAPSGAIRNRKTHATPAAQPITTPAVSPTPTHQPPATIRPADVPRLERARKVEKSSLVSRLSTSRKPDAPKQPELPPHIAAEVSRLGLAAAAHAKRSEQAAPTVLQAALAAARPKHQLSPIGVAVALLAIVAMGGIIFAQNSPKLAFHSAANRAGIDASLPTYMPSTLHQVGPVNVEPGAISLNFSGLGAQDNLNITQRSTDWDSSSLRDNFVSRQTDKFKAVEGQGLTIFVFNNNQATWVNHGIWYSIVGNTKLGIDQILKIAYGL